MVQRVKRSNNKKRKINMLVGDARHALVAGRHDVCEHVCRSIDAIEKNNPDVANFRGVMCSLAGRHQQAETLFVQAINGMPKKLEFRNNLGQLYLGQHLYKDAADVYGGALALESASLSAQTGFGLALIKLGYVEQAIQTLRKAKEQHPQDVNVLMGLAGACCEQKHFQEARSLLTEVIERSPNNVGGHFQLGLIAMLHGETEEAELHIRKTLSIAPAHIEAWMALANLKRFQTDTDPDLASIQSIYQNSARHSTGRMKLAFVMGRIMDTLKHYDQAFEYIQEANDYRVKHSHYNQDAELGHLQAIMQSYTSESFAHTSGIQDETPVFIVGMPRCGSMLVEQILVSHPAVGSRGQWGFFESVLADYSEEKGTITLEQSTNFSPNQWQELGRSYLEQLKSEDSNARRIIDKTLVNLRLLGSIHCALPKARIIHVRRHPLDNCWSIYKSNLPGYLSDYGCNPGQLGYYYRMYERLMQHWRDVLPEGVMYELDYEDLVNDQEYETRRLLDACGLPWDEQCLRFYETDSAIHTASSMQACRPISAASIGTWKPYEKHLQPLVKILGVGERAIP